MPEHHYDVRTARSKLRRLFSFLRELNRVRTPPPVHTDAYPWLLRLDNLPRYDSIRRGQLLDPAAEQPLDEGVLLQVGRPVENPCPIPPPAIAEWIRPGWEVAGVDPTLIQKRRIKGDTVRFDDDEDRLDAYDDWMDKRLDWAGKEQKVVDGVEVFTSLFELWGRIERESEKYQLFVSDGILVADGVRHPLLVQEVTLHFDPTTPLFTLRETDADPEVYTPAMRVLGLDSKGLKDIKDRETTLVHMVSKEQCHPLGGKNTAGFLEDMVQRYWRGGGFYLDENDVDPTVAGPYVFRQPTLFLGFRTRGFGDAADKYVQALKELEAFPEALLRVVGIDPRPEALGDIAEGETDLLLTSHANAEQRRTLQRLDKTGAVLIQGPPGTGKSHTIANMIGHLLAQKKSILVTSQASKPLAVVRDKVAEPLRPLCVSLLDSEEESAKQLEESISGIVNTLGRTSIKKLQRAIDGLEDKRRKLQQQHEDLTEAFRSAMAREYAPFQNAKGKPVTPAKAARILRDQGNEVLFVPGPIGDGDLPLDKSELKRLFRLAGIIERDVEAAFATAFPSLDGLPSPKDFKRFADAAAGVKTTRHDVSGHWSDTPSGDALDTLVAAAEEAAEVFDEDGDWILDCIKAGQESGQAKSAWRKLLTVIDHTASTASAHEELLLSQAPKIKSDTPPEELAATCKQILAHLRGGKKLGRLVLLAKAPWRAFLDAAKVDRAKPSRIKHFEALAALLEVQAQRADLRRRWTQQVEELGGPAYGDLGRKPEKRAQQYGAKMQAALAWHTGPWATCRAACEKAGFDWQGALSAIKIRDSLYADQARLSQLVQALPERVLAKQQSMQEGEHKQQLGSWRQRAADLPTEGATRAAVVELRRGLEKRRPDTYQEGYEALETLAALKPQFDEREQLLATLRTFAPGLATAIAERRFPFDGTEVPRGLHEAVVFRRWADTLEESRAVSLDDLQKDLHAVAAKLHEATAEYAEKLAWVAQLGRVGLEEQQALTGWLGIQKKMGKGKVKNIGRLRSEARKLLVQCRQAVPVWIMPLSRVVESFDITTTQFDVVIIDEASQSDVLGLMAFALGKEVAVVGDHEQVSPYGVGHQADRVSGLIDEYLTDIPNSELYDGKTSVYDLARQSFGETIRLLEHFRCVPEIIQFSNNLCYGGEIQPLRESSAAKVSPAVIEHTISDATVNDKVNEKEALSVASLVAAMTKLPEYEGCTIGVISMVGTEQALYIDSILRRRLKVSVYQQRRILCGSASQFQGDERDIVILSMVDAPKESGTLAIKRRPDTRKAFNVAASRAKDQLWVVHSLRPNRDLKSGDLRQQLIAHAKRPATKRRAKAVKFTSDFHQDVHDALMDGGYLVTPNFIVGNYSIDLVVEAKGARVAVQCEGDRVMSQEELDDAIEQQLTLERLGWRFVRLRGSDWAQDPDGTLSTLRKQLRRLGIGPAERATAEAEDEKPLKAKVVRRADIIRTRWKDLAPPPAAEPANAPPKPVKAARKKVPAATKSRGRKKATP